MRSPATALVAMPDGMPPALIVERFDIRESLKDKRMLALEDLCSVLDLPTTAKYSGTMERVARAVRPLSTAPEEDLRIILKRALFAWLIADGDMHLKNMALLKIAEPGDKQFRSVRMAPLYDAVTTRVFPRLQKRSAGAQAQRQGRQAAAGRLSGVRGHGRAEGRGRRCGDRRDVRAACRGHWPDRAAQGSGIRP